MILKSENNWRDEKQVGKTSFQNTHKGWFFMVYGSQKSAVEECGTWGK